MSFNVSPGETRIYSEMFDYLRGDTAIPNVAQPLGSVVFGRNDPLVAHKAGELANEGLLSWAVITGGVGKDSSNLTTSEARFLGDILLDPANNYALDGNDVHLEEQAKHGGENARFSLKMIADKQLLVPNGEVFTVTHATSTRRLGETLRFEGAKTEQVSSVHRVPNNYVFDPQNADDRHEASAELVRLLDWPEKGLLFAQDELPSEHAIELARRDVPKTPINPSPLAMKVLRLMPASLQQAVIARGGGKK